MPWDFSAIGRKEIFKHLCTKYRNRNNHNDTNYNGWKECEKNTISERLFSEPPCDRRFYEVIWHHRNDDRSSRKSDSKAPISRFLTHIERNSIDISESGYETKDIVENVSKPETFQFSFICESDSWDELHEQYHASKFDRRCDTKRTREWFCTHIIWIRQILSVRSISVVCYKRYDRQKHDTSRNDEWCEKGWCPEWREARDKYDTYEHDQICDERRGDEHITTTRIMFTLLRHTRCNSSRGDESSDRSRDENTSFWADHFREDISDEFDSSHNDNEFPERVRVKKLHRENTRSPVRSVIISKTEEDIRERKTLSRQDRKDHQCDNSEFQCIHEFLTIDLFAHFREIVFRSENHKDDDGKTRRERVESFHGDDPREVHHHPCIFTRYSHMIQTKGWVRIGKSDEENTEACADNHPRPMHQEKLIEPCHERSENTDKGIGSYTSESYLGIFLHIMARHLTLDPDESTEEPCKCEWEKNVLIHRKTLFWVYQNEGKNANLSRFIQLDISRSMRREMRIWRPSSASHVFSRSMIPVSVVVYQR